MDNLSHGLLVENFKQSLLKFIIENELDIQTKAVILDNINFKIQHLSEQKTQQELEYFHSNSKKESEVINRNE